MEAIAHYTVGVEGRVPEHVIKSMAIKILFSSSKSLVSDHWWALMVLTNGANNNNSQVEHQAYKVIYLAGVMSRRLWCIKFIIIAST